MYYDVTVSLHDALNTYDILIDHLNDQKIHISGTGKEKVLKPGNYRLKGFGLPKSDTGNGDLIIMCSVEFPTRLL